MGLLIAVIVVLLVAFMCIYLVDLLPLPVQFAPVKLIAKVLIVLLTIVWLLQAVGLIPYWGYGPYWRH